MTALTVEVSITREPAAAERIRFSVEDLGTDSVGLAVTLIDHQIRLLERVREDLVLRHIPAEAKV